LDARDKCGGRDGERAEPAVSFVSKNNHSHRRRASGSPKGVPLQYRARYRPREAKGGAAPS